MGAVWVTCDHLVAPLVHLARHGRVMMRLISERLHGHIRGQVTRRGGHELARSRRDARRLGIRQGDLGVTMKGHGQQAEDQDG